MDEQTGIGRADGVRVAAIKPLDVTPAEMVALDYGQKQDLLLMIAGRVLELKNEFVQVSGRYAEIKAELDALKHVSSMIQSELKATQSM